MKARFAAGVIHPDQHFIIIAEVKVRGFGERHQLIGCFANDHVYRPIREQKTYSGQTSTLGYGGVLALNDSS